MQPADSAAKLIEDCCLLIRRRGLGIEYRMSFLIGLQSWVEELVVVAKLVVILGEVSLVADLPDYDTASDRLDIVRREVEAGSNVADYALVKPVEKEDAVAWECLRRRAL